MWASPIVELLETRSDQAKWISLSEKDDSFTKKDGFEHYLQMTLITTAWNIKGFCPKFDLTKNGMFANKLT